MKNEKDKKIIQRVLIALCIIIVLILILFRENKISILEKNAIKNYSDKMIIDVDLINGIKENEYDKYIVYALKNNFNQTNTNIMSVDQISKFIKNNFDKKINSDQLIKIGITTLLLENGITYNDINKTYEYHRNLTLKDIANKKIEKYSIIKIKKLNNETYRVTYQKYEIKNPYEVLNYYNNANLKKKKNKYDTSKIEDYISGSGSDSDIINSIRIKDLENLGRKRNKLIITYKVVNRNLEISDIR